MRVSQALILAGGLGTRLGNETLKCPKPMLLVNGEPFLNNIIWNLKRHGINNIVLSIGYRADDFKEYYKNRSNLEVNIKYVVEEKQLGTGGAIKRCEDLLHDFFFLINGDTIFDINFHDLSTTFVKNKIGHLALNYVEDVSRYGEVHLEGKDVISFKEKSESNSGFINSGVGLFSKKIIDFIPLKNLSLEKNIFPKLLKNKLLTANKYNSFFLDIGIPSALRKSQTLLPIWKSKSALLLDRDGVINIDYGYVHSLVNFEWIKFAKETIKLANDLGILVIVITNQAGIARGFYSEEDFRIFTNDINNLLIDGGAHIDATYFCPHHPKEGIGELRQNCDCRKPKSGMFKKAISEWNLDKKRCFFIGDKDSDIVAASNIGLASHLFSYKKENLLEIVKKNLTYLKI